MFVPLQKNFLTIFDKSKKSFRPEEEIVFSVKTKTENLKKKNYSQPLRNIFQTLGFMNNYHVQS